MLAVIPLASIVLLTQRGLQEFRQFSLGTRHRRLGSSNLEVVAHDVCRSRNRSPRIGPRTIFA